MCAASGIDWIGCHRRWVARRKKRWEGENESRTSEEGAANGTKKGWYFARWLLIIVVPARKSNFSPNGRNIYTIRSFINCNLYLFVSFFFIIILYIYIIFTIYYYIILYLLLYLLIYLFLIWMFFNFQNYCFALLFPRNKLFVIYSKFIQSIFWKLLQEFFF